MTFTEDFLKDTARIANVIDKFAIEAMVKFLHETRERNGRLFILGVGGSAANASHAVNDFRKIGGFEAYAPTDNISELTARTNDEGWETVFEAWLKGSRLSPIDTLLVLSVSGGSLEKNMSANLVKAVQYAKSIGAGVLGIVGSEKGYTARVADVVVIVPVVDSKLVTPHSEAWQSVVWHLLVSHPLLKRVETRWESVSSNRAVFFDRDGTLTTNPKSVPNIEIVPEAFAALTVLKAAGFKIFVVTNQADIGRGITSKESVNAANKILFNALPIDDIYVCPHTDEDKCGCRKPLPGMLLRAAAAYSVDLKRSFMVGDTSRDLEAGLAAGCRTMIINDAFSLTDIVNLFLKESNENNI